MGKRLFRLTGSLAVLALASACSDGALTEPQSMALEVAKRDVQAHQVSFTVRVINWDGSVPIEYRATACTPAGDLYMCVGPFLESKVTAERFIQPVAWGDDQCGVLVVFQASLPNGAKEQVSHITCSRPKRPPPRR